MDKPINTPPVLHPPSHPPATCCKLLICGCNQCDSYLLINMPVVHRIFPHVSLLTNASLPSCLAPLSISSLSFLFSFPLLSPSTLFSHFHGLILHANTTPPPTPPCSQIAHKLTLKASIIAYVKTRTNAQSAAYLTGLILSSCTISPAPLIHTVFMLND